MYANARSHVLVDDGYSDKFDAKVGVHQGWVLSPMIFIIVLEALSLEFHSGVPLEDLSVDEHLIIAESLEECVKWHLTWKEAMEERGLRVTLGKMKIMICGSGQDLLQSSGEFPCAIFRIEVGGNSIFCNGCKHWVHKKCSELKCLTKDPDYRCTWCQETTCTLDGRPQREVQGPDKLEVVASICYLGDMLSAAGGCELSTTKCENRLEEVQGAATSSLFPPSSFKTRGRIYSSCVRSVMLHASETWPLTKPNLQCLQRNDREPDRPVMSSCKTLSPSGPVSYLHSLALRILISS